MPAHRWSLEGGSANGNLTGDGLGQAFAYDAENRLIAASGPRNATLGYDPMGRLAQVSDVATRRMAYDGDALAEEYDGSGNLLRRFVHGPGVDDPIVWYEGTSLADRRFLHSDHQGSVVAVSDGSGNASAVNRYDEYGVPQAGFTGRFGYTGQAWVPELELWYYKARFYSGPLGRFLQVDPVGYDDQINLYAYVGNDPLNASDPSGETCTQDSNQKTWTCKLDDREKYMGTEQGRKFVAKVEERYTQAVNTLMENPGRSVTLSANAPTGSRVPIMETTTQGQMANSLIAANVTYSDKVKVVKGAPDTKWRADTTGLLNEDGSVDRKVNIVLYPRAMIRGMSELKRTFVHEGAHPTQGNYRLFQRYIGMGGTDWANDHREFYKQMADEILGR